MGLDQYAKSSTCDMLDLKHDGENRDPNDDSEQYYYWRKHNRLQGWMENLWLKKYQPEEHIVFNCEYVELSLQDIVDLENAITNAGLPKTEGFFFGNDSYEYMDNEALQHDLDFIKESKELLAKGKRLWYTSWW